MSLGFWWKNELNQDITAEFIIIYLNWLNKYATTGKTKYSMTRINISFRVIRCDYPQRISLQVENLGR